MNSSSSEGLKRDAPCVPEPVPGSSWPDIHRYCRSAFASKLLSILEKRDAAVAETQASGLPLPPPDVNYCTPRGKIWQSAIPGVWLPAGRSSRLARRAVPAGPRAASHAVPSLRSATNWHFPHTPGRDSDRPAGTETGRHRDATERTGNVPRTYRNVPNRTRSYQIVPNRTEGDIHLTQVAPTHRAHSVLGRGGAEPWTGTGWVRLRPPAEEVDRTACLGSENPGG